MRSLVARRLATRAAGDDVPRCYAEEMRRLSPGPLLALLAFGCGGATQAASAPCAGAPEPIPRDEPAARAQPDPAEEAPLTVRAGSCETEWLPEGVVTELSPEEREALLALVRSWLSGGGERPLIEHRRGILFAKSEYDEGADPPYPSSSSAASLRACGLTSSWLREHLRALFAMAASPDFDGVTCDRNVCCIAGIEFVPDRAIVFSRVTWNDAPAWAIQSTYEVAEAALGDEQVAANRRYVAAQLARERSGTCRGEPPGFH